MLYFFFYELLLRAYKARLPAGVTISVGMNLVIGFFADTLCMPAVVPLELLSMRQSEGEPMSEVISKVYRKSGLTGFLQGWTGYIYGGIMPAIQFTAFDQLKTLYLNRLGDGSTQLSLLAGFIVGAIARTLADVVSYPVRVPQNIQQSSVHPLRDASFPTIVRKVL